MKHLSTTKWGASILHVNNKELSIIKQGLELLQQQSGLLEPIQMLEALEAINTKEKESPKLTPEKRQWNESNMDTEAYAMWALDTYCGAP